MITKTVRYHIQLSDHRTTISLDKIISDLMAIKLGEKPGTKEAHQAVRKQLDTYIERDRGMSGHGLGRYLWPYIKTSALRGHLDPLSYHKELNMI